MSKRKATIGHQGEGGAKKLRAAGAAASSAAAASASAASSGADSLDVAIRRAKLGPCIAVHTLKLADTIKTSGSHASRMKALIVLLKADADRPESLLDWSLVPAGDEVSAHRFSQRIHRSSLLFSADSRACCFSCCSSSAPASAMTLLRQTKSMYGIS